MNPADHIAAHGLVPVYASDDAVAGRAALQACHDGGLRTFEFTNRTGNAIDVFRELRALADESMPGMLLGAGTILDVDAARRFHEAGADFLVSPVLAEDVAAWAARSGAAFIPGVSTPSELHRALLNGATLVKLFPAASLGRDFLHQLLGPLAGSRIMVTGGIRANPEEVTGWLQAGASAVGLGSDLIPGGRLDEARLAQLTRTVRHILDRVAEARQA